MLKIIRWNLSVIKNIPYRTNNSIFAPKILSAGSKIEKNKKENKISILALYGMSILLKNNILILTLILII